MYGDILQGELWSLGGTAIWSQLGLFFTLFTEISYILSLPYLFSEEHRKALPKVRIQSPRPSS